MSIKRLLLLGLFLFSVSLFTPKTSQAIELPETLASENSIVIKIQEGIEYFFAFRTENKITVLEKHAEKRLIMAQGYVEEGKNDRVQSVLQSYLQIKERQNNLLEKTVEGKILGIVQERTIEQQKTMEEIKTKIDEGVKQKVVQVQEQVVNQVAKKVVDINGPEGVTEFLGQVARVWAPGTGPGGEGGHVWAGGAERVWADGTGPGGEGGEVGVVYAGGGKLIYAPGTGPGGGEGEVVIEGGNIKFASGTSPNGEPSGTDTKTVEVKTGGVDSGETNVVEGENQDSGPKTSLEEE
ncbi:MAG: DUF5667 domain-containing protein [Candidatus Shapirobacteria bacterium]|nr:DUF5667 domain-containing protein [Candidatus Shapirobacteria bacterium]